MGGGTCAVCQATAGQQCAGCKVVYYCGRDHQRAHWPKHRSECRPVALVHDPILGRHLIASRNISAGELIIKESPTVLEKVFNCEEDSNEGPKIVSKPVCLGCLKPADINCPCPGCGWPLCELKCQESPQHKSECILMSSRGYRANIADTDRRHPDYVCIIPLRVLLMPEEKKRKILQLQSHLEMRRKTPLYNVLKTNVVTFIRDALGLAEQYSEEEILEICAIFDTNAFEVKPYGGIKVRGLYTFSAMMSHDCTPNSRRTCDDKNVMFIYATTDIKKGDSINTNYTQSFWSTSLRRLHLRTAKCFDCSCKRCSDPTEFDLYIGAIVCSRCSRGKIVSSSPLDDTSSWKCTECGHEMSAKQIEWGNQAVREEIEKLDKNGPKELEEFLEKYKNVLHPTNGHALQVKYALSEIYGDTDGFSLAELSENQLERKIEICHELLDVIKILEPGSSRIRAQLLFGLQSAMAMQAKLDFEAERITKERAQEILEDSMKMLQESTQILRTEPGMEVLLQERIAALALQLEIVLEPDKPQPNPRTHLVHPPATANENEVL